MERELSCNVSVHEEELNEKKVFVVECSELGISDFGESLDEALSNLKTGINLLLEEVPEKKELLKSQKPLMVTRLFL
jgi:predicted RNase H-like HicB family nuclease